MVGVQQCICFYEGYHTPPPGVYGRFGQKRGCMDEGVYGSWRILGGGIIWTHVGGVWIGGGVWMLVGGVWILVGGVWMLVGGVWMLVGGVWMLVGIRWLWLILGSDLIFFSSSLLFNLEIRKFSPAARSGQFPIARWRRWNLRYAWLGCGRPSWRKQRWFHLHSKEYTFPPQSQLIDLSCHIIDYDEFMK